MAKEGREKIVAAAFQLFLKNGYQSVRLNDIIVESGLSKGAIYHHFKSKYDVYLATLEAYFFKLYNRITISDGSKNLQDRIKTRYQFFVNLIDFVENTGDGNDFPIRRYFLFQLESEKDEKIRKKITNTLQEYHREVEKIISEAIQSEEIRVQLSSKVITEQLMCMIEGIVIHHSTLEKDSKQFLSKKYTEIITPYLNLITKN